MPHLGKTQVCVFYLHPTVNLLPNISPPFCTVFFYTELLM